MIRIIKLEKKVFTALVTLEQPKRCLIIGRLIRVMRRHDTTKEGDKYI